MSDKHPQTCYHYAIPYVQSFDFEFLLLRLWQVSFDNLSQQPCEFDTFTKLVVLSLKYLALDALKIK